MIRVILLDDEKWSLDELEYHLKKNSQIKIAGVFTDPAKAIEEARKIQFDAAFLDINMPLINGLNVAKEFLKVNENIGIVFITAYDDYAAKAFELNAIDYILKPISSERIKIAIDRIIKQKGKNQGLGNTILEKLDRIDKYIKQDSERIAAFDDDEINILKMAEVLFFEAQMGKTYIVTENKRLKTRENLDRLEEKLFDYGFYRCHRSYIVNLRYVNRLSPMFNNNYIVKQEFSNAEIPVSRNKIKEMKRHLGVI